MDDALADRLARELADAIAAAVNDDTRVAACRERARARGFELRVSLNAEVGIVHDEQAALTPSTAPLATTRLTSFGNTELKRANSEMTSADRRFLKSLRISPDEARRE